MRFREIIQEKVGDKVLYHSTYLDNATQIIISDKIEARTDHHVLGRHGFRPKDINKYNRVNGVSFSRSFNFAQQWRDGTASSHSFRLLQ